MASARSVSGALDPLLRVEELTVSFGDWPVVDGVSFELERGASLGIVGESGCGKTMTALALMGLAPEGATVRGSIRLGSHEIVGAAESALAGLRGNRIALVFQEPLSALNPVLTVGRQVAEMHVIHRGVPKREAHARAVADLTRVRIPDAERRALAYPHQLSGGMRQRVMIAMAIACEPDVLIADEPTTALDVTVQAQILDLLCTLEAELGMALVFISHNLAVIAKVAARTLVMYAGRAGEIAPTSAVLGAPRHPYSDGLLQTVPRLGRRRPRLRTLAGAVPVPGAAIPGCSFAPRCARADPACVLHRPKLQPEAPGHLVACHHPLPPSG